MYTLFLAQTAVPTQPPAEQIEQATRVINAFEQLGPLMALLFVVSLALIAIVMVLFASRSSNSSAINILAQSNADKAKEIIELREQHSDLRKQLVEYQRLHNEGLIVIGAQSTRTNDLFEAMNNRSANRDLQQQ